MRRTWQVRRTWKQEPDGQRRWDRAYRLLLEWAVATHPPQEEPDHASGLLRTGIDRPATTGTDH